MSTTLEIEEMRRKRFQFLRRCFELSGGSTAIMFNMHDVGDELGFDHRLTNVVTEYLEGEGLVMYAAVGGQVAITHYGIVQIEEALSKPEDPTEYFPPFNIIQVGQMIDSQIQQASPGPTELVLGEGKEQELRELIESLRNSLEELGLDHQQKSDLQAEILTMEAQASKSKPNRAIITETLKSACRILEAAAGGALAVSFIEIIKALLAG